MIEYLKRRVFGTIFVLASLWALRELGVSF
jgi:hypothetical protein